MHRKTGDIFPSCERGDGYLAVFGVLWMVEQPQKGAVEGVWEFKYWRKKIAIESSRAIGPCPILDFFLIQISIHLIQIAVFNLLIYLCQMLLFYCIQNWKDGEAS